MTMVRLVKSGVSMVVGNSGIHSVPFHRIMFASVGAWALPTAHPSSELTMKTELRRALVGLVQFNGTPSAFTIGRPTHGAIIITNRLTFETKFVHISHHLIFLLLHLSSLLHH